jgi:hypothetical protein
MTTELQRAYQALENADASGNTEDAKEIANMIRGLESNIQQNAESETKTSGVLPFANKAIAETTGAPVDLVTAGLNLIPGVDIKKPFMGSESIKTAFDFYGIDLPEEGQKQESAADWVGTGIGETSTFMIPMGKMAKTLSSTKGLVGEISKSIVNNIAKHPYLTMTSELTGGVGVGLGRGGGEAVFPENKTAQSITELAGGVAGSAAPAVAIKAPTLQLLKLGKTALKKFTLPFTEEGAMWRAGKFVKGEVSDPSKTINALQEQTISDMPPAVASGEKRIVQLYKSLIGQDPVADADTIESISKSIVQLESEMRKMGYAAPGILAEITEKRIAALELRMDRRVLNAMESAQKQLDSIPVAKRQSAESIVVRNEIEKVMRSEHNEIKKLWEEVPKDIEVGFANTRQRYADLVDELAEAQKNDIPSILKKSRITTPKKTEPETDTRYMVQAIRPGIENKSTIREMHGLRSKLLETARIARKKR